MRDHSDSCLHRRHRNPGRQVGITTLSVPIRVNSNLRPSRLVKSICSYIIQSLLTNLRIFSVYRPLRWFLIIGAVPFTLGVLLGVRWLWQFLVIVAPAGAGGRTVVIAICFIEESYGS
jgi:hypothetical protein